jgi:multisubunit Na+/H+ antiporter MnhB subunit
MGRWSPGPEGALTDPPAEARSGTGGTGMLAAAAGRWLGSTAAGWLFAAPGLSVPSVASESSLVVLDVLAPVTVPQMPKAPRRAVLAREASLVLGGLAALLLVVVMGAELDEDGSKRAANGEAAAGGLATRLVDAGLAAGAGVISMGGVAARLMWEGAPLVGWPMPGVETPGWAVVGRLAMVRWWVVELCWIIVPAAQ